MSENTLYFGDNLKILRDNVRDETVDLIYLDPPFNSKANYNVLFRSPKGHESHAQITAFEDTWHWGEQAEAEFDELIRQPNTDVSKMMVALRDFLGANDMMAYLTMMANRLLELLDGTKTARYPDLTRGGLTFKKAKKEKTEEQLTLGDDVAF